MDPQQLRTLHPVFRYISSSWHHDQENAVRFKWSFQVGTLHFQPHLLLPNVSPDQVAAVGPATLDWYAFQLGLVELISYWKATASPQIQVEAGQLTAAEQAWWHKLLINGLGEFFYQNQLDFTAPDFITWSSSGPSYAPQATQPSQAESAIPRLLISLGGGKDSAATLELCIAAKLRGELTEPAVLLINPTQAAQDLAHLSGLPIIQVTRHLDPQLLELNTAGYLNGHTPFSAMAAWVSTVVAHLYGYTHSAVSNERSSNEGNVIWLNQEINHQYSKTYTFEHDFQTYIAAHFPASSGLSAPFYFSFLRPLYELQIGKLFAKLTESKAEVRSRFRSCNRGQKTNSWCGDCAKCLFAYIVLRPWISHENMKQFFGQDVLENHNLYPTFLELIGQSRSKPFDCVGTHEESICAAYLCREAYRAEGLPLPALLTKLDESFLVHEANLAERTKTVLASWNDMHSLPEYFTTLLRAAL